MCRDMLDIAVLVYRMINRRKPEWDLKVLLLHTNASTTAHKITIAYTL